VPLAISLEPDGRGSTVRLTSAPARTRRAGDAEALPTLASARTVVCFGPSRPGTTDADGSHALSGQLKP
jgi:hypothetical protein